MPGNRCPLDIPMKPCSPRGLQQGNPQSQTASIRFSLWGRGGRKRVWTRVWFPLQISTHPKSGVVVQTLFLPPQRKTEKAVWPRETIEYLVRLKKPPSQDLQ